MNSAESSIPHSKPKEGEEAAEAKPEEEEAQLFRLERNKVAARSLWPCLQPQTAKGED